MAIQDDFTINKDGDIRGGVATNYTVLELHRWLMDVADDAVPATSDDIVAITSETPSDRSTDNIITLINGYNINDATAVFFYDGSITQDSGDTVYSGLVVVGDVVAGTNIIIVQDNALLTDTWTAAPNADAGNLILMRKLVKTRADGANINGSRITCQAREFNDTYAEFSVTMALGNNTAALFTSDDLNNATAQATVNAWGITNPIEGFQGIDVTGDLVDEDYYSGWNLGAQTPPDLYEFGKDIQRRGTAETIHGMNGSLFRGISHEWAYTGEAGAQPATNDSYSWGTFLNTGVITGTFQVGEKVTGGTSLAVGRILSVDATNTSLVIATETGTWQNAELITGFTSLATATSSAGPVGQTTGGGVATVLAVNDLGTTGTVWVQIIKGTAPSASTVTYAIDDHTQVMTTNGSAVTRTIPATFIGASTGANVIGAFGVGIVDPSTDLSVGDKLTDLLGTLREPPNNVTFTVTGLTATEDRVLVGPRLAGVLETEQLLGATGQNASGAATYVTIGTIPAGTPPSGTLRVFNGEFYDRVPFTSRTTSTYTLTGTLPSAGATHTLSYDNEAVASFIVGETLTFGGGGTAELLYLQDDGTTGDMVIRMLTGSDPINNDTITAPSTTTADVDTTTNPIVSVGGYISYIDALGGTSLSYTAVYTTDVDLFVRVRDGGTAGDAEGIKTFESPATFGSANASIAAIRTSDV